MSGTQLSPISAPHRLFIDVEKVVSGGDLPAPTTAISLERDSPDAPTGRLRENRYYLEWCDGQRYALDASHMYPLDLFKGFMAALRTYECTESGGHLLAEAPDVFTGGEGMSCPPVCPRDVVEVWDTVEVLPRLSLVVRAKIEWWRFECLHPPIFEMEKPALLSWCVAADEYASANDCAWITATSALRLQTVTAGFYRAMDAFGIVVGDGACVRNEYCIRLDPDEEQVYADAARKVFVKHSGGTGVSEWAFVLPKFRTLIWREQASDPRQSWVEVAV